MTKNSNQIECQLNRTLAARTHFPSPISHTPSTLSNEEKIEKITTHLAEIMDVLGLDLTNDSLNESPRRIAEMYVNEIFAGLDFNNFPDITYIEDKFDQDSSRFIVIKKIAFTSFCEHHFVPMDGYAHVAYIPNGKIIGLSKVNRIVRYFSQRPQVQERLTAQIADSLSIVLDTPHVAVATTAKHSCVTARGVQDCHSSTATHILRGDFKNNSEVRREFFDIIHTRGSVD